MTDSSNTAIPAEIQPTLEPEFARGPGRAAEGAFPYKHGSLSQVDRRLGILSDYLGGMTAPEVGRKWGMSANAVYVMAQYWGVKLPKEERERRRAEASQKSADLRRGPRWSYVWPDCPDDKLEDYKTLRKYMSARQARATLEAQA